MGPSIRESLTATGFEVEQELGFVSFQEFLILLSHGAINSRIPNSNGL
jgi:hypothetical protein